MMKEIVAELQSATIMPFFLSGCIFEIRWFHASLALEFSREVIWWFEIEAIGNLLDALIGGRKQLLGSLQFQRLLVERRGEAGMLLEELAERRVASAYLLASSMTIIFTVIVMLITHFRLKHINMIDALKSNE